MMAEPTEKWARFWYFFRRRSLMSAAVYPTCFTILFSLLDYGANHAAWRWPQSLIAPAAYSISIQFFLWLFFSIAFGIAAAIGPKAVESLGTNKIFNILMSIFGIIPGLFAADHIVSYLTNTPSEMSQSTFMTSLFISILIALILVFYYQYKHFRDRAQKLEQSTAESRYHTLKTQMQPHFLFNSLNSLSELIHSKPTRAIEMSEKLADLYRTITANSQRKTSNAKSEIGIVETYLTLEKMRFGDRLAFRIELPGDLTDVFLPSLMLQTLVENAVKHGLSPSIAGGEIIVSLEKASNSWYKAAVTNSGQPLGSAGAGSPKSGLGVGLANTRERLDLLYGNRHHFSLLSNARGHTVAEFQFSGEETL